MIHTLTISKCILSVIVLFISSTLLMAQNPVPFLSQPLVPDAIAPGVPGCRLL